MKLSIIIPVFNAGKYLKRCLDSVLAQSIEEKEIICIDDGSTDDSLYILKKYEEKYDDFYVFQQENKFAGAARNYGLSVAKGEYIHFLDADDYILNDIYSQIYEIAVKLDADYIKTRNTAFDMKSGEPVEISAYTLKNLNAHCFNHLISLNEHPEMLLYSSVTPWCGWVKRSYIEKNEIKFDHLKCVNDRSFYAAVISNTDRIVLCDYHMVVHQVNNSKSLAGQRSKNFSCCIESFRIIENNSKKLPVDIRKKVMTFELYNIMGGYRELTEEQKNKNDDLLREFLKTINWGNIDKEIIISPVINEISRRFEIDLKALFDMHQIIDSIAALEKALTDKESIVIYGAGKVSGLLIKYIRKKQFNINFSVVVSDMSNNPAFLGGIPVKERSKELLDNAQKIIIAVLQSISIYIELVNAGYDNIQVIGDAAFKELQSESQYMYE